MANSLESLTKQREELVARLEEIDARLADIKEEKQRELLKELQALGWTGAKSSVPRAKAGQRKCGICGEYGHNSRSCPKKPQEPAQ